MKKQYQGEDQGQPSRWLVTGGCGFIGSNLIRELLKRQVRIRVLDNLSVGTPENLPSGSWKWRDTAEGGGEWGKQVEVMKGDVRDESVVETAVRGAEVIVHLAANAGVLQSIEDPQTDFAVNVLGTLHILWAAHKEDIGRVVLASSAAAVGDAAPPLSESTLPAPTTPYGAGKLAGEAYARAFHATFGLQTVVLRFGNVYGPRSSDKESVVAKFIKQWLNSDPLSVHGDGMQTRDYVFLQDLLEAVLRAASESEIGGEVFQIATNRETSVNELAEALISTISAMGFDPPTIQHGPARPGDVRRNYSDTSKATAMLGWTARTNLPAGLSQTVEWFYENYPDG